jgi:sulfoxide reductase heme-binding subunit YedZ
MRRSQPLDYVWWLVSDASGIVALSLISFSVAMGLAMAARVLKRPQVRRACARMHEQIAIAAVAAIAAHGLALLGDHWLKPGWRGITIPFALAYRPGFTGIGIIAGYIAVLLGPSFYLRRRIGARRWRKLHRAIAVVWVLSAVHALGAGSDASKLWLRVVVLIPVAPIVYLFVVRTLGSENVARDERQARRTPQRAIAPPDAITATLVSSSSGSLQRSRGLRTVTPVPR